MNKVAEYILGLDMGVASIGWAVVSTQDQFVDTGVRIFPSGIEAINTRKEKHPNLDRRTARGMRRRVRRKAERKAIIKEALKELGWIPSDPQELEKWHQMNVYELRHRGLHEELSLQELGRIILHLNQRRGFLSLRKSEESNNKEDKGMLAEIEGLQKEIETSGSQTLGSYLYSIYQRDGIFCRLRNRHIRRQMLHHEFSLLWEKQATFHPSLTDELRYGKQGRREKPTSVIKPEKREVSISLLEQFGIENLTFFQRKVYWKTSSIGKCELEGPLFSEKVIKNPKEELSILRAPVADRRFQEFRMLQEINNLRILDSSSGGRPIERSLNPEEREHTITYLTERGSVKFEDLKKSLNKKAGSPLPEQFHFNLENGGRKTISGMDTDKKLKAKGVMGKDWLKLDDSLKNQVVEILCIPNATDDDIEEALREVPELNSEAIHGLLKVNLPTGYGHLSIIALEKLLPHMRAGKLYMAKDENDSALHAAGYSRRDEQKRSGLELLPSYVERITPGSDSYDPHQVVINNPIVLRALVELRKVVNSLIRKYGKPAKIHIEMARDLKMSPKQRSDHNKKTRKLEEARATAAEALKVEGIFPTRDAIELYRLWEEQGRCCMYSPTGESISFTQLFNGECDIDHILPYSRSGDNSFMNKVVSLRKYNAEKGNRLPHEWLAHSSPQHYDQILQRAKKLPQPKYKKFTMEEVPEGFTNRDLNDTAWMAKAARQYLSCLYEKDHYILGTKGTYTARMRDEWRLHAILRHDGVDMKNRDDHRHHALDAAVIALCNQSRIQSLQKNCEYKGHLQKNQEGEIVYHLKPFGSELTTPWPNFQQDLAKSLNSIWVSHRARKKVSGPLHKETQYGKTQDGKLTVRKNIHDLSKKEVTGIIDPAIKKLVEEYIDSNGGSAESLKQLSPENPLKMKSGMPVRKTRIAFNYAHLTLRQGTPHEVHVQSANTHHVGIYQHPDGTIKFQAVPLIEAMQRLKRKESVYEQTYAGAPEGTKLLMHLSQGETILCEKESKARLFTYNTFNAGNLQMKFHFHTDGSKTPKEHTCYAGTFYKNFPNARKVTILPSGQIRHSG